MKTINPLVVSVGPTADATPIYPIQPTEHGGGVKKVVAVAAMVVIPIAAPAIASSIAASGVLGAAVSGAMATTVGAAVSSAVVGAGLGAITAKVTGQNVKAGAIAGALGGGFGGYRSASAGTFGTPQGGVSATFDRAKQSVSNLFSGGDAPTTDGGTVTDNAVKVGTKDVVEKEVVEKGFLEKMSSVPSKVLDKVTNPDTIANLTLQAGGQLLATALIPPGSMPELSAEEQQVLEEYKAELADLKENNEAAFNAKMDAAQQYLVQAGYFNPEYFGLQAANRTAIDQERKMREYKRTAGLTNFRNTGANAAEERRMALQGARNVQSSFDSGFQKGMTAQDQKIKAGYGMIPSGDPSYANALANLTTTYSNLRGDADKQRQNLTELFGRFGTTSGNSKEDEKKLEETKDSFNSNNTAGLNTTSFA
jgi:hypothetical protein